jgi:23S rRNA pseudouridine2605 synthase
MALERLQKYLASAGIASRRHSEHLIRAGRVAVNGHAVTELGTKVNPQQDRVTLDGRPVHQPETATYIMLNKPRGYVTTASDERGRPTILDLVPQTAARLFPVGRLDIESEGLLLLTNDGALAQRLTHPRYGTEREYLATLDGPPSPEGFAKLRAATEVTGREVTAKRVSQVSETPFQVRMVLTEGRKREVREIARAAGYGVTRLERVRYGPLRLGRLRVGAWRALTSSEVANLLQSTRGTVTDR